MEVTYAGVFIAGILSFVSPCVLPLVPAYLCFLGGTSLDQLVSQPAVDRKVSRRVFFSALAFVLGFATVFVLLGASATSLSKLIAQNFDILAKIAGVVIVIFGLHFMGAFRIAFLNYEKRVHVEKKPAGLLGAFLLGLAFAFGWTPCVGPVLATVLFVAASGDSIWSGVSLLSAYAAGIGLPFLLAALFVKPFMAFMVRFRKHMRKVELLIGGLLVITGVMIFTGSLANIGQWLLDTFPIFTRVG